MKYSIVCPFKDCVCIEEQFTSDPAANGFYIELTLTVEDDQVVLYGWDSKNEKEDCILAQGALPVLKELVSGVRSSKDDEFALVYEQALRYLVNRILAQEWQKYLMIEFHVNSTLELVEVLLNKGMLDWLQEL